MVQACAWSGHSCWLELHAEAMDRKLHFTASASRLRSGVWSAWLFQKLWITIQTWITGQDATTSPIRIPSEETLLFTLVQLGQHRRLRLENKHHVQCKGFHGHQHLPAASAPRARKISSNQFKSQFPMFALCRENGTKTDTSCSLTQHLLRPCQSHYH